MSLRTKMLLLVLLATLVPAMALTFTFLREREADVVKARERLEATADAVAEEVSGAVRATQQLHYALSRAQVLNSGDREACSLFLADALLEYPQFTGLLTIMPNGDLFCDSLRSGRHLNLTDRTYFRDALAPGAGVGIEPVIGRLTGTAVLQVARAVHGDDGRTKFVLLASLNLEKLMESRSRSLPFEAAVLALVDSKGTLLTWHPGNQALRGTSVAGTALHRIAQGHDSPGVETDFALGGVMRVWAAASLAKFPQAGLSAIIGVPRAALGAAADQRLREMLAILGAVSALAFIGALALAELGVRRHTARIIQATNRLSLGDFGSRVGGPYPRGELGRVMAALDATAARFEEQSGEIQRLNEGLELRVAARTADLQAALHQLEARTQEVESRNVLLANADLYKSQFLANMSHELRTPLNAVIGYAELIESTPPSDVASLERHSMQVRAAAHDLLGMINDLLELARIASGAQRPLLDVCEARAIANEAIAAARQGAAAKRIRLTLQPGPEIECSADPRSMRMLLKHLLGNAVKFTAEGGRVEMLVSRETAPDASESVRFAIGDNGIGIDAGDMERLFAPFVQLDGGLARRFGGTGLGLALVKGLIELQGGTLAAKSELGKGSTFWVLLPIGGVARRGLPGEARAGQPA